MVCRVGILGVGALGSVIARHLISREQSNVRVSALLDIDESIIEKSLGSSALQFFKPDIDEFLNACDVVVEALPPQYAPQYIKRAVKSGKTIIPLTLSVLVTDEHLLNEVKNGPGKIIVPTGSIAGLDGVRALDIAGITHAKIVTSKPPKSLKNIDYLKDNNIVLDNLQSKQKLYSGPVTQGAKYFPANVNVAAALSLSGVGADKTIMEIWADPDIDVNIHDVVVESAIATMNIRLMNKPDPEKPKSSMIAAYSVISEIYKIA